MKQFYFFLALPYFFLFSFEPFPLKSPERKNLISQTYIYSEPNISLQDYPWELEKKKSINWEKLSDAPLDCESCYFIIPKEKKPTWLRLELENFVSTVDTWILEIGYHNLPEISIFVFEKGRRKFENHSGTKYPFYQRPVFDRNFVYPLNIEYGSRITIYLFINSPFQVRFPVFISSPTSYYKNKLKEYLYFFFIFGVAFTFVFYNLIFFLRFKDKNYFFYTVYALFFGLFLVRYSGFGFQYLWPAYPRFNVYALPTFILGASVFFTIFIQNFLSFNQKPVFLKVTSFLIYIFSLILLILFYFLKPEKLYSTIYLFVLAVIVNGLLLTISGIFLKRPGATFLIFAYLVPATGGVVNILRAFGKLAPVFPYENLLYWGSLWELFFFSMALSDRLARLEAEKREIENLAKERSIFFSGIAHDLRQPLNLLLGYTQELKDRYGEKESEILPRIVSSAEALKEILEDILEYDRLERGSLRLNLEPMNIEQDLFLKLQEMFFPKAEAKGLTLLFESEATQDYLADKGRILRILINLVSNAVKYTEKGGILVSFREKIIKNEICGEFSIKDTGIGLTEEELRLIFRPYVRVGKYKKDANYGIGLGLTITKKLAELLRGELTVESQYGFGSEFIFRLPLLPLDKAEIKKSEILENKLPNLKVLIVDDDPEQVQLLEIYLKKWGVPYQNIYSPQEIQKLPTDFQIALLDYHVGLYDGREIAKMLKEKMPNLKIIFITGSENLEKADLPEETLVVLTKPINFSELHFYLSQIKT